MTTPKILILAGDATEDLELFYGLQRLTEEGYGVTIAAPAVKRLKLVSHDFDGTYRAPTPSSQESPGPPTSPSPMSTRTSTPGCTYLVDELRNTCAIMGLPAHRPALLHRGQACRPCLPCCHALAPLGVLKGRVTTAFRDVSAEIEMGGGIFVDDAPVIDGNLVGARDWSENAQLFRAFLEILRASRFSAAA